MTELINSNVENIASERSYWFVRTDGGQYFDTFYRDNFVGIGWDEITENDIRSSSPQEVKSKIARTENWDITTRRGKSNITGIYNKILKFENIKINDIIVIPSMSSSKLAFGIVADERIYSATAGDNECLYRKRRKVNWVKMEYLAKLDTVFYKIIPSMHAVSQIVGHDRHIDSLTNALYTKNGFTHFVLHVTKGGDIDFDALLKLMESVKTLSKEINEYFELGDADGGIVIKLNVQSDGRIELIKRGIEVILLAMLFSSCAQSTAVPNIAVNGKNLIEFAQIKHDTLSRVDTGLSALEVKIEIINR